MSDLEQGRGHDDQAAEDRDKARGLARHVLYIASAIVLLVSAAAWVQQQRDAGRLTRQGNALAAQGNALAVQARKLAVASRKLAAEQKRLERQENLTCKGNTALNDLLVGARDRAKRGLKIDPPGRRKIDRSTITQTNKLIRAIQPSTRFCAKHEKPKERVRSSQ